MKSPAKRAWFLPAVSCAGLFFLLVGCGKAQASHTPIDAGRTTILGNSLTVSLSGITRKCRIDQPPKEENGVWTMILDGITHTKKDDPFE